MRRPAHPVDDNGRKTAPILPAQPGRSRPATSETNSATTPCHRSSFRRSAPTSPSHPGSVSPRRGLGGDAVNEVIRMSSQWARGRPTSGSRRSKPGIRLTRRVSSPRSGESHRGIRSEPASGVTAVAAVWACRFHRVPLRAAERLPGNRETAGCPSQPRRAANGVRRLTARRNPRWNLPLSPDREHRRAHRRPPNWPEPGPSPPGKVNR